MSYHWDWKELIKDIYGNCNWYLIDIYGFRRQKYLINYKYFP